MRLPQNYNTSIDDLLNLKNNDTIFLSTWDREIDKQDVPLKIIEKSVNIRLSDVNRYQYMDEMEQIKKLICYNISLENEVFIQSSNMAIATNGTASAYLIISALNKTKQIRPLILTPIYFSYVSLLNDYCDKIEFYQIFTQNDVYIDFVELENVIKNNDINVLIMNDPIFGCGISIKHDIYQQIIQLCKKYDISLIIDYVYGGMEWENDRCYSSNYLLNCINDDNDIILIDSMTKRLFINGIKSALIFGKASLIYEIEKMSVYTLGCMVYSQISLLKEIYNLCNKSTIYKIINNNITSAKINYDLIKSRIITSNCILDRCDSGYFALFKIPYTTFGSTSNKDIAQLILEKCNVITIPHDRYLYFNPKDYCFRINLLCENHYLLQGISSIINTFG